MCDCERCDRFVCRDFCHLAESSLFVGVKILHFVGRAVGSLTFGPAGLSLCRLR